MTITDDAIEASGGQFQTRVTVTWPGGTNPIFDLLADVSIDRSVQDQPQSVTQIAGAAAAQATITLKSGNGTYLASMLSPFSTNAWSTRTVAGYGVNQIGVVVEESVWVPSSGYSYTTLFTGTVTNFALNDDGSAVLTCIDRSASIQGTVNLPAAGKATDGLYAANSTINPVAVVDLALRSGGLCLTPPARAAALLSIPGIGSSLPDVGDFMTNARGPVLNRASPWPSQLATVDVSNPTNTSGMEAWAILSGGFYSVGSGSICVEGWVLCPLISQLIWSVSDVFTVSVSAAGAVQVAPAGPGSLVASSSGVLPLDGAWHYLAVTVSPTSCYVRVDGTTYTLSTPVVAQSHTATDGAVIVYLPTLGFQVWTDVVTPTTWNNAWVPNYSAALDSVPQRLTGLPRQSGAAWSMVQQVAQAYGDVAYFDGAGAFHYETRTTWAARRYVTPTYLKDDSRIISGSPSWGQDSLRRSVAVNLVVPVTQRSITTAPAWMATDIYTVAANSSASWDIALDYSVFNVMPFAGGFQTDADHSWSFAVNAASVGDPAAVRAVGTTTTITPTSSGFKLTIRNPLPYAVSMWSPGNGGSIDEGPYLVVHGTTVTFPDPRLITVQTGSAGGDDLVLDDNPWRQDDAQAGLWANSIASDVCVPQIIWGSVNIPVDPRLSIGSVVTVKDSPYMDVTHPVQIVGIAYDMPAEGMHTMTLTIRSAYAPTGWILDVPGRSELDSTTLLIV